MTLVERLRDAADSLVPPHGCGKHRDLLREAGAEIERLSTPYCLGVTTIRTVANDGQLALESGHAFIAADDLYKQDPYAELTRLHERLRLCETVCRAVERFDWSDKGNLWGFSNADASAAWAALSEWRKLKGET